jgi:hypothetical protein
MAESILDETRRRDRWALGMILVLIGSVRLWTGRAQSAVPCLEEAQEIFSGMDDTFGRMQANAVLGRALVASGRIAEGFAIMPGSRPEELAELPRENRFAVIATANASVQVGDTARTEDLLALIPELEEQEEAMVVGDTERVVATNLHRLQLGDVTTAVEGLRAQVAHLAPTIDPNLHSALALAHAAEGQVDAALAAADLVDDHERASYLDHIVAGMGRALAHARRGDHSAAVAAFDQVRAAAEASEDPVTASIVRLAEATAASARGDDDAAARSAAVDQELAELGLEDTGWRRAFRVALGISSAA